ncbi:MAG: M1 family metallopeptidase [Clostridia bacterium]|nr:M1 family metallopeptidase [Clostridia bacterium]
MRKIKAMISVSVAVSLPFVFLTACKGGGAGARYEYEIQAEYFSEEGRLDGDMKVTVPNNTEGVINEIPFALYGNAFREGADPEPVSELFSSACYYDGVSYGGMEIKEVTGGKSWSVDESGNVLTVSLNKPLYPDESVTLSVQYSLTLAKANHRLGVGEHCVNLSYFYPMLFAEKEGGFYQYTPAQYGEPFVLSCADFKVTLTVPQDTKVACGGKIEQASNGGKTVYRYKAENVRDAAFVLGDFSLASAELDGVQIDYYYFADEAPDQTLKAACDALTTYSGLFGDYAYSRYALAETDLFLSGMEYSGFTALSSLLRKEERAAVVAHETAHQWWYASVGSNQAECAWQDEGLAEYSVALFYEKCPEYGNYRDVVTTSESAYRNYYSVASQLSKEVDTKMSRPLSDYSGDYEYRILSYDKGVVLFDRLRETIGNRRFFSALKDYAEKYAGRVAAEADLIGCFSSQEQLILSFTEGRCVI